MPPFINTDTKIETVAVDGNIAQSVKQTCDIEGAAGRRLAAVFTLQNQEVVLIFQAAPA